MNISAIGNKIPNKITTPQPRKLITKEQKELNKICDQNHVPRIATGDLNEFLIRG